MRRRTSIESSNTSNPAMRTVPEVAGKKQARMRMVVLFPAPLGPSSPTICPRSTENDTFDTAVWPGYRFVKLATSIIKPLMETECSSQFRLDASLGQQIRESPLMHSVIETSDP